MEIHCNSIQFLLWQQQKELEPQVWQLQRQWEITPGLSHEQLALYHGVGRLKHTRLKAMSWECMLMAETGPANKGTSPWLGFHLWDS